MSELMGKIEPPLIFDVKQKTPTGELIRVMKVTGDAQAILMIEGIGAVEVNFQTLLHVLRKVSKAEVDEMVKRLYRRPSDEWRRRMEGGFDD